MILCPSKQNSRIFHINFSVLHKFCTMRIIFFSVEIIHLHKKFFLVCNFLTYRLCCNKIRLVCGKIFSEIFDFFFFNKKSIKKKKCNFCARANFKKYCNHFYHIKHSRRGILITSFCGSKQYRFENPLVIFSPKHCEIPYSPFRSSD